MYRTIETNIIGRSDSRVSDEEEMVLCKKIEQWKALDDNNDCSDERCYIIQEAHEAINQLVEKYLWISDVYSKKYAAKYPSITLTVDDLKQEACIGLIHAAKKFDVNGGCKFSSYAIFWVEQSIRRAIEDKGSLIRKPASAHNRIRKVHKFSNDIPAAEVAKKTGIREEEVIFIREMDNQNVLSLDAEDPNNEDDGISLYDKIDDGISFTDNLMDSFAIEECNKVILNIKDPLKRKMLLLYLGCTKDHSSYSYAQIAKITGVTKYRVKQAIENAFCDMRSRFL